MIGLLYCLCPLCLASLITLGFWLDHCIVCVIYDWLKWLPWVFDWFSVLSVSFMISFSDYFGFLIGPLCCLCSLWLTRVITLGFDWSTEFSVSIMIVWSDNFGCLIGSLYCPCPLWLARVITFFVCSSLYCLCPGFTTLNWKLFYHCLFYCIKFGKIAKKLPLQILHFSCLKFLPRVFFETPDQTVIKGRLVKEYIWNTNYIR